jgi:hypothetical protein
MLKVLRRLLKREECPVVKFRLDFDLVERRWKFVRNR